MRFIVSKPAFGRVGGHRVAVVRAHCEGATASPDAVLVILDTPNGPKHLGYALDPAENAQVYGVVFNSGQLFVTALTTSPQAAACCPDIQLSHIYTLGAGATLQQTESTREPWADGGGTGAGVEAFPAQACASLRSIDAEIASLRAQRQDLMGGSVDGVPTYSESALYSNLSEWSAIKQPHCCPQPGTLPADIPVLTRAALGT
jgi:hypothetical protein